MKIPEGRLLGNESCTKFMILFYILTLCLLSSFKCLMELFHFKCQSSILWIIQLNRPYLLTCKMVFTEYGTKNNCSSLPRKRWQHPNPQNLWPCYVTWQKANLKIRRLSILSCWTKALHTEEERGRRVRHREMVSWERLNWSLLVLMVEGGSLPKE